MAAGATGLAGGGAEGPVVVAGRYALDRELGRGASGRVLLARDLREGDAPRAIKLVAAAHEARLRLEFGLLAGLSHPNLARVYELVRIERSPSPELPAGSLALVTELAPGRPASELAQELAREPQARLGLALLVGIDVARALRALHARGVLHGDVKPENVIVRDDRKASKLIDLGLASEHEPAGAPAGTLGYMAPELFRGERSPASDLYALGATLRFLLDPAAALGDTRSAPAAHWLSLALRPAAALRPLPDFVPPALRRLCDGLLEPDPTLRPARAADVYAELVAIAQQQGVEVLDVAGGGADDVPTSEERARAALALPLSGQKTLLSELSQALQDRGLVVVYGAPGSGRSRLVSEAVFALQSARAAAGGAPPTYRRVARLPQGELGADSIVHVVEAETVSHGQAAVLLRAAEVEGYALTLVLERTEPLVAEGVPQLTVPPLGEGELRKLLELGLPGSRIGASLVREAATACGGLAGRLCRILAHGYALGADLTRPSTLRAIGAALGGAIAPLPESARSLAELLAVAGGALGPLAAQAALGSAEELSSACSLLFAGGMATQDAGRVRLRPDLIAPLRQGLPPARVLALAARLPESELDGRARGHLWLARAEPERAHDAFAAEVEALRVRGQPELAAQLAREAKALLTEIDARRGDRLALLLSDALRAQGRYDEAAAELVACETAPGLLQRAELARISGASDLARDLAERVPSSTKDDVLAAEAQAILARLAFDAGELERAQGLAAAALARLPKDARSLRPHETFVLVSLHAGQRDRAAEVLADALRSAREQEAHAAEARLSSLWAELARQEGDASAAAQRFSTAFELAEAAGEQHAAAAFLHNVGIQRLDAGELGPATAALREAARRLARLGREGELARALYNLGHATQLAGADDVALASARRALDAAVRAQDAPTRAYAACLAAEIELRLGERKAAAVALQQLGAVELLPPEAASIAASRCAAVQLLLGDLDAAAASLERASEAMSRAPTPSAAIEEGLARCQLELAAGHSARARALAEQALGLAQRGDSFDARLRATLAAAHAARADGDLAFAARRLAEVRSLLDHVARTLSPSERARLRAVDAYRPALEAPPSPSVSPEPAAHDQRWRSLAGIAKRLLGERRLPRLYELLLDAAIELSGAERGYLVLRDHDGRPHVRVARGLADQDPALSRSIVARVLGTGRPLTTMDASSDERLSSAASVHALSLRSVVAVPLVLRGSPIGALYLEDRLRPFAFGDLEVSLLSGLSDLGSLALESAQLLRAERRASRRTAALRARLAKQLEAQTLELDTLKRARVGGAQDFEGIVAHSAPMQRVLELTGKAARAEVPVLIGGESGSGKELVARAIHSRGPRRAAPFVSENCGAIPEPLLESALFGHVRGAFTGADRRRLGLFEVADGGTLFLDEIGEMSPSMQARLLRVLQDGEVRPVGGERSRRVNVRVLAATHRNLEQMVAAGRFREDLYYRLAVLQIHVPPLRERPDDIAPLVAHLLEKHAEGRKVEVDRRALGALSRHDWPGNVRQLENEIRRALVLCDEVILPEHLSPGLIEDGVAPAADPLHLRAQVDELERRLIRKALESCAGNQTRAARALGISRYGLQKMIRRLELESDGGLH